MPRRRETYPFSAAQLVGGPERPVLQPVLPIVIWGPDGARGIKVEAALVDTGADYCMCPSKITKPIGYKLRSGEPIDFGGAVATGKAWRHFADITILTHDYRAIFHKISDVPLALVQKRKPFPVLLGRDGFLDQFVINIDFPNKLFTLELI
jgi:predicted aspartyl protease